jgi:DegV family protein with EDD domain
MHNTWANAKAASQTLLGRLDIEVFDSQSIGLGQGWLLEIAGQLIEDGCDSLDELARLLRLHIPRIYSLFNISDTAYAQRAGLLSVGQATIGGMLGIRPFLSIEEGRLIAIEKARFDQQVSDRFLEFVAEFANIEKVALLYGLQVDRDNLNAIVDRLKSDLAERAYPTLLIQPSLACFLDPLAIGVMIFEQDWPNTGTIDDDDDDDDEYF